MRRKMVNSEINWIGGMPEDWECHRISTLYMERNTKVSDTDYKPLSVTKQGILLQLDSAAKTDNGDNRRLVMIGDFVINSRSDRRGSCGISLYNGSVSVINTVLMPTSSICNKYFNYFFCTERFADEYYRLGNGIVDDLWSTKWSSFKRINICVPKLSEQQAIADYLDRKCSQIDSIIDKQKVVIERLKLYKQSIITEAVTKGLDPTVEMKDSGTEWIGEVPDRWETCKIKRIGMTSSGSTPLRNKNDEYYADADIKWVKSLDLNDSIVTDTSEKITEQALKQSSCKLFPIKTVMIAMYGGAGTIGKCGILSCEAATNQAVCSIICNDMMNPYYLLQLMRIMKPYWMKYAVGTRVDPNISQEILANMFIPLPPLSEQQAIADYLVIKCSRVDSIIAVKQQLIDKIGDYKKSLIYECVTGKREVALDV